MSKFSTSWSEQLSIILPRLNAFSLRLSGNRHDADDLVQLSCIRAIERLHQFDNDTSLLSWMYSIIYTSWIDEVRSRKVRGRHRVEWDDGLVSDIGDASLVAHDNHILFGQVLKAIHNLPSGQRETMLLIIINELSYKEAAKAMRVSVGTVMSRLARARQSITLAFAE